MVKRNSIEVIINAKDNASKVFEDVAGNIQGIGNAALAISGAALVGATTGMIALGVAATNTFADFEQGMNEVFTLLPNISEDAMRQMEDQLLQFDNAVGRTSDETIPALYQALSAGVPQDNVFEFLELANQAAIGGATDLETAVDGISSVVNAYGDELINATEASDLMFTAVRLGKTNFEELSASLFNVVPNAAALGVGFGDVTAALATITAQGVPTSVATTQMRAAFVELGDAGSDVSEIFTRVSGESFKDFIAGGGSVADAMSLLETEAATLGIGVNEMFGSVEAGNAALALTGASMETFVANTEEMNNAAGATEGAFDQMNQGITTAMNKLNARWESTLISIGRIIAPILVPAINTISDFVQLASNAFNELANSLDPSNPNSFFGMLANGASIFDATFTVASRFFAMLGFNQTFVTQIATAFAGITDIIILFGKLVGERGVAGALSLMFTTFEDGSSFIERFLVNFGATEQVARTIAQTINNVADAVMSVVDPIVAWFTANVELQDVLMALGIAIASVVIPAIIGILAAFAPIIVTFGLLVAGIAMFRNAWETDWLGIRTVLTDVWENTLLPAFERFGELFSGDELDSSGLITVFETISSWIINTGIPAIATFVAWFLDNLPVAWETAKTIWENVLKPAFEGIATFITDTVLPALQLFYDWFITTGLPIMQDFIENTFLPAWQGLVDLISDVWVTVSPFLTFLKDGAIEIFQSIIDFITNDVLPGWGLFTELMSGIWDLVSGGFQLLVDGITLGIGTIVGAVQDAIDVFNDLIALSQGNVGSVGADIATGVNIRPPTASGGSGGFSVGGVTGHQFGGAVSAGVPIMVGESGREMFIPSQDGTIATNQDTNLAQQGNNPPINITMNFSSAVSDDVARDSASKLKRTLQAEGFNITGA